MVGILPFQMAVKYLWVLQELEPQEMVRTPEKGEEISFIILRI